MNKWLLILYLFCFGASVIASDNDNDVITNLRISAYSNPTHFVNPNTINCLAAYCSSVRSGNNFNPDIFNLPSVATDLNTVIQFLPEAHDLHLTEDDFASNPNNIGTVVNLLIKHNVTLACDHGCAIQMNSLMLKPHQESGCCIQ